MPSKKAEIIAQTKKPIAPMPETVEAMSAPADASGTFVTRQGAADILGVSKTTIRRCESELRPIVDGKGRRLFHREQIETLTQRVSARAAKPLDAYDAKLAAQIFGHLDDGLSATDIVKSGIHPDVVEHAVRQRARMRGAVVLPASEIMHRIRRALPLTHRLVEEVDEKTLLAHVDALAAELEARRERRCFCGYGEPGVCVTCYNDAAQDKKARDAARAAEERRKRDESAFAKLLTGGR